jgi:multimeric flavodoxin WrbA
MKFLIISGNPKKDGLCYSVTNEIIRGASDGGAETQVLTLDGLEKCRCCGNGWGTCIKEYRCEFGGDGFDESQKLVKNADIICLITPVYWGEMSESLKCFLDRLRRCEFKSPENALSGKPVLLVASPGGSGNGLLTCLEQMDRFCRHTGAIIFDYIGINRWNSDYKRQAAYSAAKAMAEGRKHGETV